MACKELFKNHFLAFYGNKKIATGEKHQQINALWKQSSELINSLPRVKVCNTIVVLCGLHCDENEKMCVFMWWHSLGYREWSKQRLLRRLLELEKVRGSCNWWLAQQLTSDLNTHRAELHHRLTPVFSYQRPEDGRRPAPSGKSSGRLDQEVEATPAEILRFTMATEAVVSVGTNTEEGEEDSDLRERLSQSEKERAELQEMLSSKEYVNSNMI